MDGLLSSTLGYFAVACFGVQGIPQIVLNYRRGSVAGLSFASILIKYIGGGTHFSSSIVLHQKTPILAYGFVNVCIHVVLISQFAVFATEKWLTILNAIMFLPFLLASMHRYPFLAGYLITIKPVLQLVSLIPQVVVAFRHQTTRGLSMTSLHFNFLGGFFGTMMCILVPPGSLWVTGVYAISMIQSLLFYILTAKFDGIKPLLQIDEVFDFCNYTRSSILSLRNLISKDRYFAVDVDANRKAQLSTTTDHPSSLPAGFSVVSNMGM